MNELINSGHNLISSFDKTESYSWTCADVNHTNYAERKDLFENLATGRHYFIY